MTCSHCGIWNDEHAKECRACAQPLTRRFTPRDVPTRTSASPYPHSYEHKAQPPKSARQYFVQCAACGTLILFGGKTHEGRRYCSASCLNFSLYAGFCRACLEQTTEEGAGKTFLLHFHSFSLGTTLIKMGAGSECPTCHSQVMRKWVWVVLPVFPCSPPYRVLQAAPNRYLSRRLRSD